MQPSLVIRVPESAGPTRTTFTKVLAAGEFEDATDPDWPELISQSTKYETGEDAPGVHINLYRDEVAAGRHGRYTFEFVGEDPKAVAKVRDEIGALLVSHKLHAVQ